MADRNAQIILKLVDQASAGVKSTTQAFTGLTAEEQKAEQATLRMAQAYARLDAAQKNPAAGAQRLRDALSNATVVTQQHGVAIQTQIASLDAQAERLASGANLATQFGDAFKSSLVGIIGPAALVTAGFAALSNAVQATEQAFKLKATIDQSTAAIQVQLRGVRESSTVFQQASQFAHQYGLTQQETNDALRASVGILRQSTSGADELLGVLARLQVLSPEQGLEGAALAVKELASGSTQSLVGRFELSRSAANKMKEEIAGGADAVQVLGRYLDGVGVTMDTLAIRTQGAAGKMNELNVETEKFNLALGGAAGGPGLALLEARIALTRTATGALSGDLQSLGNVFGGVAAATNPFVQVLGAATIADDALIGKLNEIAGTTIPSLFTPLHIMTDEWARFLGLANSPIAIPNADRVKDDLIGIALAAGAAADAIGRLQSADAAASAGVGRTNIRGGVSGIAGRFTEGNAAEAARVTSQQRQQAAEVKRIHDSEVALQLSRTKTAAERIAILQRELKGTTDVVERNNLLARIEQERNSVAKGRSSGLSKELALNERIYDSINKQRDALLDIEELTIRDRQQDREDAVKRRTAERILNSPFASADLKARAQDALALIDVQDRKRAQEIAEKSATVGGSIVNGRILQSRPGGGPVAVGGAGAPVNAAAAGAGAAAPASGGQSIVLQLVDGGRILAQTVEPFIMDQLLQGVRSVSVARGG